MMWYIGINISPHSEKNLIELTNFFFALTIISSCYMDNKILAWFNKIISLTWPNYLFTFNKFQVSIWFNPKCAL